MKKFGIAAAALTALWLAGGSTASAQKLYWTTSGAFGPFNIQWVLPSYPDARDISMPVNMYVLDHPKGLVVLTPATTSRSRTATARRIGPRAYAISYCRFRPAHR